MSLIASAVNVNAKFTTLPTFTGPGLSFDTNMADLDHCKDASLLQASRALSHEGVQRERQSISMCTLQPANVHSFNSTKRLALRTHMFTLGMM